jgi:hypothetical protein
MRDSCGAPDMIRVAVSENQVLELVGPTAKAADRREHGGLLTPEAAVDKRQPVLALDQEGVCLPHRDNVHAFDPALHDHGQTPRTVYIVNALGAA